MLPLRPPPNQSEPGYPDRSRLLADPGLRQRVLAILAAPTLVVALGGCGQGTLPGRVEAPRSVEPTRLLGDVMIVQPPEPAQPVATPMAGAPVPPKP